MSPESKADNKWRWENRIGFGLWTIANTVIGVCSVYTMCVCSLLWLSWTLWLGDMRMRKTTRERSSAMSLHLSALEQSVDATVSAAHAENSSIVCIVWAMHCMQSCISRLDIWLLDPAKKTTREKNAHEMQVIRRLEERDGWTNEIMFHIRHYECFPITLCLFECRTGTESERV